MREFRFILGRRSLIVFLAFFVVAGTIFGVPAATRTLADSSSSGNRGYSPVPAESAATEGLVAASGKEGSILDPSGPPPLLQTGSGDTWTETNTERNPTTTPTKRYGHAMATISSGYVLLFGGFGGIGSGIYLNDTWLFNTATGTWGKITGSPSTPTARYYHAMAATSSGDVLLFGGQNVSGSLLNDTWLFNTATKSWTEVTGLTRTPTARYQHAIAATSSGVLLFGGYRGSSPLNDTWFFNTSTKSWSQVSTSPTPPARYYHAMAATPSGVLLSGGHGISGYLDDTWLFNADASSWSQVSTSPPSPLRYAHAMAAIPSEDVLLFGDMTTATAP